MLYFNHSNFKKAQSAGKLYEFGRYEKMVESGLNDDIERAINADTPEEKKELSEYINEKLADSQ